MNNSIQYLLFGVCVCACVCVCVCVVCVCGVCVWYVCVCLCTATQCLSALIKVDRSTHSQMDHPATHGLFHEDSHSQCSHLCQRSPYYTIRQDSAHNTQNPHKCKTLYCFNHSTCEWLPMMATPCRLPSTAVKRVCVRVCVYKNSTILTETHLELKRLGRKSHR